MYDKSLAVENEEGAAIVALPSRLEQLKRDLDGLAQESEQLEMPLVAMLIGAAAEAVTDEIRQRRPI